ncbi:TAXI family TRAP transporter solute-binding subunit [Ammoniphilus sp. YIM 78166]|uniref:TAXI family TRAP transporter solute-binding subunit n=1 Tax=Ammoniphilus sp. YIM 78166 TaxID=1644106 RepID=UPI00106F9FF3|nr:TAXI family TRAP transporter solute-binding subunit [Ammoniphilus sp. YIM 78166]
MKKFWKITSSLVLAMSLAACGSSSTSTQPGPAGDAKPADAATSGQKLLLNIDAAPTSTPFYAYYAAVSQAINKHAGDVVETTVVESGGTKVNATNLQQNKADIAFMANDVGYESYAGEGEFEGKKNENIRILWNLPASQMHWAVTVDSGINSFEELNGKPFNPSTIGGGGEFITFKVFEELGFKPDFKRMKLDQAGEQVINGTLVGFSYNGQAPISKFTEVHAQKPLKILSLTDAQIDQVLQKYPYFIKSTISGDAYKDIAEAQTIGVYMSTVANKDVSDNVVYAMTKAYWDNIGEVETAFPALKGITIEETINNAPFPLHKGAIKYYEEKGFTVPAELKVD